MGAQNDLESKMNDILVKNAPFQIPENGRKGLVQWAPWLSLIFGVIGIFAAMALWKLGHTTNQLVDFTNTLNQAYGVPAASVPSLDILYYLALGALVLQAALMIIAFPGLQARSKARGWNLLLFGTLASFAYGLFVAFTAQGSIGNLVGSIVGLVIGLYILAQIRSHYNDKK